MPPRIQPIEWRDGILRFLDQTRLPVEVAYVETSDYRDVAEALRRLAIRGAPLIGIAAAYALALAAREDAPSLERAASELFGTRPTAVNLGWALERVLAAARDRAPDELPDAMALEASRIHRRQIGDDARMGELGAALIAPGSTLLTHCNTGSLATGGIGTALGVVKTAHWQGKGVGALVGETRPLLQGARLTAWELASEGVPHHLIVDAAAPGLIARGEVQAVLVGADRIAANGDVANKVGTYGLALAAHAHGVPFYVVAPVSSIDPRAAVGDDIVIEQRPPDEVTSFGFLRVAPEGTGVLNPAFDVAPARCVTAIVTERGVLRPPLDAAIRAALRPAEAVTQ